MTRSLVKGFSLIELLVAIAVLTISLVMLYKAAGGVLQTSTALQMQQKAIWVAHSVLNSRDTIPPTGWQERGSDVGIDWVVYSAPIADPAVGQVANPVRLHQVSLRLSWEGRRDRVLWSIDTVLPETRSTSIQPTSSP